MKQLKTILILLLVAGAMASCDSTNTGEDENGPEVTPKTTVIYEVFGTYLTCDIDYRDSLGVDKALPDEPLDWIDSLKVPTEESFLARVTATCADVEREGKATIRLFVDGLLLESVSIQGNSTSGTAQRLLSPSN